MGKKNGEGETITYVGEKASEFIVYCISCHIQLLIMRSSRFIASIRMEIMKRVKRAKSVKVPTLCCLSDTDSKAHLTCHTSIFSAVSDDMF